MSPAFAPMSASEQLRFHSAYLAYLRARDGLPDVRSNTFDVREKFFADIDANPTRWVGPPPVDQQVFDRNHARATPEPGLDEATLWALATAKTNRAERYGVEYSVANGTRTQAPSENPHTYVEIEEFYHTRILKDALATLGVRMEVGQPSWSTRLLVKAMVLLPQSIADMFVLCGEIFGVAVFSLLLEKARVLFAAQPAVLARIEALFAQIMVDEVGHVHFVRSKLGPRQLWLARRLLPLVCWGALSDLRELVVLFGRDTLMARARAADVDAAAAPYADRFVFPAEAT
jgi:hypothetical protein